MPRDRVYKSGAKIFATQEWVRSIVRTILTKFRYSPVFVSGSGSEHNRRLSQWHGNQGLSVDDPVCLEKLLMDEHAKN